MILKRIIKLASQIFNDSSVTGITIKDALETLDEKVSSFNSGEGHISIFPSSYDSIGQGSWVWYVNSNYILNGFFYNTLSSVDVDEISYKITLSSGIYNLNILTLLSKNQGITKFYLDDVEIASFDNYNSSEVANVTKQQTDIIITKTTHVFDLRRRERKTAFHL